MFVSDPEDVIKLILLATCAHIRISRHSRGHTHLMGLRAAALLALAAAALAACGGDSDGDRASNVPGHADSADLEVIQGWVTSLRRGDVHEAASYFALPSVAQNGPALVRIRDRDDAELFNRSLPCGAVLIRAEMDGELTIATFRLTERPGPGACGAGTGELARTSFRIDDGLILEWRRVPVDATPTGENIV